MGDEGCAQRSDADPGASGELEVFREPAVEQQALRRIVRVGEFDGVADLVETLGIEGVRGQLRRPPIARHYVVALQSRFELAFARDELEGDAGQRQPDIAGALRMPVAG